MTRKSFPRPWYLEKATRRGNGKTPVKSSVSVTVPSPPVNKAEAGARPALSWTVHPLRDHPWRGVLLLGVVLAVEGALAIVWESPWLAVIAAFLLVAATGRFLFATHFVLDEAGVHVTFLGAKQHRPWSEVRRLREAREGVLLSPFRRPSPLDGPRGIFVVFADGGANRAEVMAELRARMDAEATPREDAPAPDADDTAPDDGDRDGP